LTSSGFAFSIRSSIAPKAASPSRKMTISPAARGEEPASADSSTMESPVASIT
jgi:hypothetical protein